MANVTLEKTLAQSTREGELYEKLPDGRLRCYACGHRCPIPEGKPGVCQIRFNKGGKLYVPWGYVTGLQDDPIEKKPFYHALPGSKALSFGMLGCSFHCSFCQNWISSQAIRDPEAGASVHKASPQEIVRCAIDRDCESVSSTYNEPLITSEWAVAIFKEAKKEGLVTSYVSNGNGTPEVLDYLRPWLDLFKIDLKGFDDHRYRELGGRLEIVCQTIREAYEKGFWVEVVTLLIPGFNDSAEEVKKLAEFLASVSPDIPWHVTAYHRDYKMDGPPPTSEEDLFRAAEIGKQAGLRYIYAGNLPGMVGEGEHTCCHGCGERLIKRWGFSIQVDKLSSHSGKCFKCGTTIPGFWKKPS